MQVPFQFWLEISPEFYLEQMILQLFFLFDSLILLAVCINQGLSSLVRFRRVKTGVLPLLISLNAPAAEGINLYIRHPSLLY